MFRVLLLLSAVFFVVAYWAWFIIQDEKRSPLVDSDGYPYHRLGGIEEAISTVVVILMPLSLSLICVHYLQAPELGILFVLGFVPLLLLMWREFRPEEGLRSSVHHYIHGGDHYDPAQYERELREQAARVHAEEWARDHPTLTGPYTDARIAEIANHYRRTADSAAAAAERHEKEAAERRRRYSLSRRIENACPPVELIHPRVRHIFEKALENAKKAWT